VVGIVLFWSAPDLLSDALGIVMPLAFYESQNALILIGSIVSNFLFTAFLR
jgi:hypothetical protein